MTGSGRQIVQSRLELAQHRIKQRVRLQRPAAPNLVQRIQTRPRPAHFRDCHSLDAVISMYEREIAASLRMAR